MLRFLAFAILSAVLISCQDSELIQRDYFDLLAFPDTIPIPASNPQTDSRVLLGRRLFYDPILSRDSSISCATCHQPERAFTDALPKSMGIGGSTLTRNSISLANVAYQPYLMREGGVPSLEAQVLVPVQEHAEFDFDLYSISARLNANPDYVALSLQTYARIPDPYVVTSAIAAFERTIISKDSKLDDLINTRSSENWSSSELEGMDLFFSTRTSCSSCHSGFNFSNYAFENNGLYAEYADQGKKKLTGKDSDEALFKVPSLRNVAITAPYMHDGSFADLSAVLTHYNEGGKHHKHQSSLVRPLGLSAKELQSLEAFLLTLSDSEFIKRKGLQDPFK
ncbi:MAG: cytochrome c peroxidase [Saprospiraceae bacterium]